MGWKYQLGKIAKTCEDKLTRINSQFVINNYPFGRNWIFDLKRILKNRPTNIIDAGANVGDVTNELMFHFPEATIYAFEPILATYNLLMNNVSNKINVKTLNYALGKKDEQIEIFLNPENTINSLKSTYLNEENSVGKQLIHVTRVDKFASSVNINHIHVLKIDVEGFEFEVLEGCGAMLRNNIDCILLEVGYEREETKVHFSDVETYLEKYNYQLIGIYDIMRNYNDKRRVAYSNNLYIKKDLVF